jgi:hypothetical protein
MNYKEIPIFKYKKLVGYLKCDVEDFEFLSTRSINLNSENYPHFKLDGKCIKVHRYVMGNPVNKIVDHIYHDKLDVRKINLRIVSKQENNSNLSGSKGRSKKRGIQKTATGKWQGYVRFKGKSICCGTYDRIEDAEQAVKNKRASLGYLDKGRIPEYKVVSNFGKRSGPTNSTSGIQGITWNKKYQKWKVDIHHKRKSYFGGNFVELNDAIVKATIIKNQLGII